MSEADIMRDIQVACARVGHRLFRNQVGKYQLADGRWISSGLCIGSSDLIGWTACGRFLAVEVKTVHGRLTPEQLRFIDIVNAAGGVAFVAQSSREALEKLNERIN